MQLHKRGFTVSVTMLVIVVLLGAVVYLVSQGGGVNLPLSVGGGSNDNDFSDSDEVKSCNGVAAINLLYNDVNAFAPGTDPSSEILINEVDGREYQKAIADDASSTTVPIKASLNGIAGTASGVAKAGYFSEKVLDFQTGCVDVDMQIKLKPASAPTITVVNQDGVTANSDTNHESMGASTTYRPKLIIRAPNDASASRYGAYLTFEYSSTYINKIDCGNLPAGSSSVLWAYNATGRVQAATTNQRQLCWYDGQLEDNAVLEVFPEIETTSTEPTEDINIDIYWTAVDIDANTKAGYKPIMGLYDESNNAILEANVNATLYTA